MPDLKEGYDKYMKELVSGTVPECLTWLDRRTNTKFEIGGESVWEEKIERLQIIV